MFDVSFYQQILLFSPILKNNKLSKTKKFFQFFNIFTRLFYDVLLSITLVGNDKFGLTCEEYTKVIVERKVITRNL